MLMPLPFLLLFLTGPLSMLLLGGGGYLLWERYYNEEPIATEWLIAAWAAVALSFFGRSFVLALFPKGSDEPHAVHDGERRMLQTASGGNIHVEIDGRPDGQDLVMTHGWGLDTTAWYYLRRELGRHFRLIMWDLPGLGRSGKPADNRYSVENFAEELREVLKLARGPAILAGHSIGGMTMQTFARGFPETLGREVSGLVFIDTTYTQPLRTMRGGSLLRPLENVLVKPLLYLAVAFWPLVWLWSLQSYLTGTAHIVSRLTSFSRGVTRGQLDFGTRFTLRQKPSIVAMGLLALLRWDEGATLRGIHVPARVIVGDADRLTLPEASDAMARSLRHADLVTIAPAGHTGILEEGAQYSAAIAQFVANLRPERLAAE